MKERKEGQEGWFIPYMLSRFLNINLGEVMVGKKGEESEFIILVNIFQLFSVFK